MLADKYSKSNDFTHPHTRTHTNTHTYTRTHRFICIHSFMNIWNSHLLVFVHGSIYLSIDIYTYHYQVELFFTRQ